LAPDEQLAFRRLSIFEGGFSLAAADGMLDLQDNALLERLGSLVDKSLLRPFQLDSEPRFRMLETVRQYGIERLRLANELTDVRHRHAAICLGLAESAVPDLGGVGQVAGLTRLEHEHANMRSALDWS